MKKWFLLFVVVCIIFVLFVCGLSSLGLESGKKKIIMGILVDYKLFEYKEGDNIVGFDVDLVKVLVKKIGYEIEVQDMDFNSLIIVLKLKQVDLVLLGMILMFECKK